MNLIETIRAQRLIGILIFGGVGIFILGIIVWITFAGMGAGQATQGDFRMYTMRFIPILICVGGLAMSIGGVVYGLMKSQDTYHSAPEQTIEGVYIIGKLAEQKGGIHVFDVDSADPDLTTFYVQVALPDGSRVEYKTSQYVFSATGEGTHARITVKGNWLLGYQMLPSPMRV